MRKQDNIIRAFSEDHVARLTGLSKGQLRSWDRRGFFVPHYAYENRRAAYSRVYNFEDVVGLRTIAILRHREKISLAELERVARDLEQRGYKNWLSLKLYVLNKQVHFQKPGTNEIEGVHDGQLGMLAVIDVIDDVQERVRNLQTRSTEQHGKVEKHRYVARNASVVAGTRIPTAAIRRFSEEGYTVKQIMREYPTLTEEDVTAALAYEERLARSA